MPAIRLSSAVVCAVGAALVAAGGAPVRAAQDGDAVTAQIAGEGSVHDFTKLDDSGNPLAEQDAIYTITPWNCVRDETTGLVWEVKTTGGGLHDQSHAYTWYDPDAETNGGAPGRKDGGQCEGSACDTASFVKAVNAQGWCGASGWRLPTREELRSIVDYQATRPAIDTGYFPNTVSRSYWSTEPNTTYPRFAWHTDFKYGLASYYFLKSGAKPVRLVREAK